MQSYLTLAFAAIASAQSSSMMSSSMMSSMMISSALPTSVSLVSGVAPSAVVTGTDTVLPATATAYPINVGTIDAGTRMTWCSNQQDSCRAICNMDPATNGCDADTLTWQCTCAEGPTPNVSNFNQTIPFFECITYIAACTNSTDVAAEQRQCQDRTCGGPILPINYASGGSASASGMMMSTSMMASASAAATTTAAGNSAPTQVAQNLGYGVLAGGAALAALIL